MTNQQIINKQRNISKELKLLSKNFKQQGFKNYHNKARCEINKKYGKFWREDLETQKTFDSDEFQMSYL